MLAPRARGALVFCRLARARAEEAVSLDVGGHEAVAFLDPAETIVRAVRGGIAPLLFGIQDASGLAGFFVVHPDRRDPSCWWLGWFAVARRVQGRGYGRIALEHVGGRLRRVPGCRRIRLQVAQANGHARRLYAAGFRERGRDDAGWHTLEYERPSHPPTAALSARGCAPQAVPAKRLRRRPRLRPSVGPFAARSIGVVRGPPASAPFPAAARCVP